MSAVVDAEPTPSEIVHTVLADQNADPSVRISRNRISEPQIEPILTDGYSGNRLYRARVAWNGGAIGDGGSATWLLKRWQPGGHGECLLGVDRPLEALAWEQGVLRREAMPPGVVTPIIGARLDPSGDAAWIVMEDVSADLGAYSRESPLPPTEAVARVKQVLDGLARLHAWWESPHRQARLRQCAGLVPLERFVWCQAASYAAALDRTPPSGTAAGSPVTDEFRADVQPFLAWLPASDRAVLETVLHRREPLLEALSTFPQTLLHGDADDRNIGLRYRADPVAPSGKSGHSPDLVLIDWEWISVGPPALDVARVCGSAAAVCSPYEPRPEALFSGELSDYYFECYRAHGGTLADRDMWRRSFGLAFLAAALTQVPFAGSMIRHGVTPVVETFERQVELLMPAARSLATT